MATTSPTPLVQLLFRSYAAGMNSAAEPSSILRDDEVGLIVNGTVRNGYIRTRPGWHEVGLSFTDMTSQYIFEQGVFQGMGFFMNGALRYYAVSVDGWLFFININTGETVRSGSQCFSKYSHHVWFQQCNRWLIVQDGESPPVVIDGFTLSQVVVPQGVPAGTIMADGWHRLAVVTPDRQRIYMSDHENNPTTTPISFTEQNLYYGNAPWFEGPPSMGKIMGVTFVPYQDSSTGIGPMVVFFERGVRAYNIAVPRTQWTTVDITQTLLPQTGSSSFFSYTDRGSDIMFRDHDGRIRSVRNAQQTYLNSGYNMPNDSQIWSILQYEDATLRPFSRACTFDSRCLFTIFPRRRLRPDGRWAVFHDGLAVLENTHFAKDRDNVWAIWTGLPICGMATGVIGGENTLVAFSCGTDGKNRLHRLTRNESQDTVNTATNGPITRAIEMKVSTGFRDFGNIAVPKRFTAGGMRISNIVGDLSIKAEWQEKEIIKPWFTHNETHDDLLQTADCGLFSPTAVTNPSLIVPTPVDEVNRFFKANLHLSVTGCCTLEEMVMNAEVLDMAVTKNTRATPEPAAPPKTSCQPDLFSYDLTDNP